ncbi:MAG: ABC transporter ATP-binding protein [Chloroflexi bacterium]|nr:ABC transporter ATP-binding protein [Chloroflexota bacterium]
MSHLLDVRNLVTRFDTEVGVVHAVNGISYTLDASQSMAIVGESGSGKSVGVLSIMGLIPMPPGRIEGGEVWFQDRDMLKLSAEEVRKIRGNDIALIFQDPMTSLNPVLNIDIQITEALEEHQGMSRAQAREKAVEMMKLVGIPNAADRLKDYPHQFSGGQRQRIGIAMALACNPALLIADEPTTALDVTIQAQITELVVRLQQELGMAIIWITHDLGVVAGLVEKVAVMYSGFIVEMANVSELYKKTSHPYTLGLLESVPTIEGKEERLIPIKGQPPDLHKEPMFCPFAPRCRFAVDKCFHEIPQLVEVGPEHTSACFRWQEIRAAKGDETKLAALQTVGKAEELAASASGQEATGQQRDIIVQVDGLKQYFPIRRGIMRRTVGHVKAVDDVSFEIYRGETLGMVGESGCGKSTTGLTVLQLIEPTAGKVYLDGEDLTEMDGNELREKRRHMQMIFQDPYASLNPRKTVGSIVAEGLRIHNIGSKTEQQQRVEGLMALVGLNPNFVNRFPHEFSGGQRQRIGIARALATEPSFIVADEPISALDVSIQAQVVNLLDDLKRELGLTYLFIAHDLSMVRYISDRVAVMYLGKIVELGECDDVFEIPLHPYTQALLSAIPVPDPDSEEGRTRIVLQGDVPNPSNPPSGCRFHTRCAYATDLCSQEDPQFRNLGTEEQRHMAACHYADQFLPEPQPISTV